MKIVLATSPVEENDLLTLMGVASYAHRLEKEPGVEAVFFPRERLRKFDEKEKKILETTALETGLVLGIGIEENNGDIYAIFGPGVSTFLAPKDDPVFLPLSVPLLVGMRPTSCGSPLPLVYLGGRDATKESALKDADPNRETYYLGPCLDRFEAVVFEKGSVKCEIPSSSPNFLLKSVPDPFAKGE